VRSFFIGQNNWLLEGKPCSSLEEGLSSKSQSGMSPIRATAGELHPNLLSTLVWRPGLITTISTTPLIPSEDQINHMSIWKYMQKKLL